MTRRRLLTAILFAVVGAACSRPSPPLVVLISIDSLRADRLGVNGYPKGTSPFIDSLAADGVNFRNAFVGTHGTTPSHTTMLSGTFQQTHGVGVRSVGGVAEFGLPPELPLVAEMLRSAGFSTIGVTDGGNMGGAFGFSRGFDTYDDRGGGLEPVATRALHYVSEARTANPKRPIFVFLHTYQVHSPYDPPEAYRRFLAVPEDAPEATSEFLLRHARKASRELSPRALAALSALYDAEIRFSDDLLRGFFAELRRRGELDRAIVLITSDHGEEFGEHGGLLHRDLLYEELVRVPLILFGKDIPRGRVVHELASSIDIVPTLLDVLTLPVPSHLVGISLLDQAALEARKAVVAQYGTKRFMVRTPKWKLIQSDRKKNPLELYDLENDPSESKNVSDGAIEVRDELVRMLASWKAEHAGAFAEGESVELREDDVRALRALGYVAGGGDGP